MLRTLDEVLERIVSHLDPERVILFGSRSTGTARPDSDYDVLVLKDDDRPPIDRRLDVECLLADRTIGLDLFVLTPREAQRLLELGSPFIEDVLETGKVLHMRKATEVWLTDCRTEREMAGLLLANGFLRGACLHAQQAVEKAFKGFLLEAGVRPPRTHDLLELRTLILEHGWTCPVTLDDLVWLNSIYRGRYPTDEGLLPHGEPSADDAGRAIETARRVVGELERTVASPPGSEVPGKP
jgi:HEPN domain-containing protein/predicted nucleotidyltransferase